MFDPATAELLKSAPELPGLDPNAIPQLLTNHYAKLVSARLRGGIANDDLGTGEEWPLERIADTYELITSVHSDAAVRRASSFVAATAQQILSRRQLDAGEDDSIWNINRDRVDPSIAAALLFLAAEQYADANETAALIRPRRRSQPYEVTILSAHIRNLARGQLNEILERAISWRKEARSSVEFEELAFITLLETLITGIELQAAEIFSVSAPVNIQDRFDTPRHAFVRVLELSTVSSSRYVAELGSEFHIAYSGPRHLASLLLAAYDGIYEAALTKILPPEGVDQDFWQRWLDYRAHKFPFIWPNHREAISQGFHQTGKSAVMVLPTGAGKTTVSSLKIAGVLGRGKKVIFLAPTHALVDQLTDDLQEIFPKEIFGSRVSNDFDLLLQSITQTQEIEVMTPERCLAMLSFAPKAFENTGLLVFDECHLLSPQSGKIRRALDGMLCVLAFNRIVPDADTLFLSAMLQNGEEFSQWISALSGRDCVSVDLLWKPSRQARGVVIYNKDDLETIIQNATRVQSQLDQEKGKTASALRQAAQQELNIQPYAIWGLQHNWLEGNIAYCTFTKISENVVTLSGDKKNGRIYLKPNANDVAAKLAASAARNNLKTIVFVNQKNHAVSTARQISDELGELIETTESEQERWDALQAELGDLKHSILEGPAIAVPHNAFMLRLERDLAERMYRRPNGAKVIVATPTLAQGLNLPAQLAILAGDKRADPDKGRREDLEAHEILNAAARAGRAGHIANGVVLLIPEPNLRFVEGDPLDVDVVQKLRSVLPEDDRCVLISDPLEVVLDRIMQGKVLDRDVRYTINRMSSLNSIDGFEDPTSLFNLDRSFAAYAASQNAKVAEFNVKVAALKNIVESETSADADTTLSILASQSGLPTVLLSRLKGRIEQQVDLLPTTVEGWVTWTINWLRDDMEACSLLLFDCNKSILAAVGMKKDGEVTPEVLNNLLPGIRAWIQGKPMCEIETQLGGNPDSESDSKKICPRSRELVCTVIPRGLSFIIGLVSHVAQNIDSFNEQNELRREVVECLGTAVRRGFDTPEKLNFARQNENLLSRVKMHDVFRAAVTTSFPVMWN